MTDALFESALAKVASRVRAELELPCHSDLMKIGPGHIQIHWPIMSEVLSIKDSKFQYLATFSNDDLAKWLIDQADGISEALIKAAKDSQFTCFWTLELPRNIGAIWNPPVRLIWDYYINFDAVIPRFDIIGDSALVN